MADKLISNKIKQVLSGIKEVFVYFNNSEIDMRAQRTLRYLVEITNNDLSDEDVDISKTLEIISGFNSQIQTAIDDALMRSRVHYSEEQTIEKEAICDLFKARINTLKMMLEVRVEA